jgi:predicted enzyme related to lactoylglutathione lyase
MPLSASAPRRARGSLRHAFSFGAFSNARCRNRPEDYIGGMPPPDAHDAQVPPHWLLYFQVADCDSSTAKAKTFSGKVYMSPTNVEGAGRFSVLSDPQGAAFALFQAQHEASKKIASQRTRLMTVAPPDHRGATVMEVVFGQVLQKPSQLDRAEGIVIPPSMPSIRMPI